MVLPSSGPISLGNIGTEFNDTTPTSISEFYNPPPGVGGSIPPSGEISFSDFYSSTNSFTTVFATSRLTSFTTFYTTSRSTEIGIDGTTVITYFTTSRGTSTTTVFNTSRSTTWR